MSHGNKLDMVIKNSNKKTKKSIGIDDFFGNLIFNNIDENMINKLLQDLSPDNK